MSKFNHKFVLDDFGDSFRQYISGDNIARLDFISGSAIRAAIYKKGSTILPTFNVNPDNLFYDNGRSRLSTEGFEKSKPEVFSSDDGERIILPCGINIDVLLDNFIISYSNNNSLIMSDREPLAYNFENEFGEGSYHYLSRENGEKIYGLGDKGAELNKAGKAYRIETADSMGYDASSTDPLYKHIPFYICENESAAYGIFYDTSDTSYIDLGKEINNYYKPYKYFKTEDNCLVYYVFFGSKLEIIQQFISICGKQAFPPKWSFDYCASTMAYTDAPKSEEKMHEFLKKVKELDLNCSGFYLSSGYTSIGEKRCVFNWNYDKFPDPERFIEYFAENGISIIPNIKPAFLCDHPMYNMIEEKGWFIKNPDGTAFVTQFWDGLGSYLDFTNPEAYSFWGEQVKEKLLNNSIIATWNDNNEFDIKDTDALADGFGNGCIKASRLRPALTYLMVESSYKAQLEKNDKIRPFLSTRSGGIGVTRLAQTWSGDNRSEFKDLRYCHYIGLTMSMSGMYFYGHDLGGFSGEMPSRELLLRWLQHGLFEPRFTIHSWNSDGSATMPWSYDDIIPAVKKIFAQRKRLIPYFYNCAYNAVEKRVPMNAPLFLYYDDEELSNDSLMLGRDILACFIFDEGKINTTIKLPEADDWYLDDKLYSGSSEVELTIPADAPIPYFVRSGSVIATDESGSGFDKNEELILTVYPIKKGSFTAEFFTDDGVSFEYENNNCVKLEMNVECTDTQVIVRYDNKGDMPFTPCFKLCKGDTREIRII